MKKADIRQFYERLRAANPHPTTELHYESPFQLLVAVILSAQATDVGVNKATARLFPVAPTPAAMAALGEAGLAEYIRTICLYRTKAKNVVATCRLLLERHGGEVPADRASLEALPGVGRKTANVVLNTAFNIPSGIIVDTHVARVSRRLGLTDSENADTIEQELMPLVPEARWTQFGPAMVLLGRYTCTARAVKCTECVMNDVCEKRHLPEEKT